MLDQLIELGKQHLSDSLKNNGSLNEQQVGDTFAVAKDSLFESLKDQALSGNVSQLTSLFNGDSSNSSFLTETVMKNIVPQLATKLGVSESQAASIANMVVPYLVNKFASDETGKADDDNGLLSMLGIDSGNILGSLGSKLGGFFN